MPSTKKACSLSRYFRCRSFRARFRTGFEVLVTTSPVTTLLGRVRSVLRCVGCELREEVRAAIGLFGFTDGARREPKAAQGSEKAAVRRVIPGSRAAPSPSRLPQAIQSAVITDPEVRVGLDGSISLHSVLAENRPGRQ